MPLMLAHRAMLTLGLVLFGIGLERLLNARLLAIGGSEPVMPLVLWLICIGVGGVIVIRVMFEHVRNRR